MRNSWLPQCLQCAASSPEDQGQVVNPTNNALSANVLLPASNTNSKKKSGPDAGDVTGTFLTVSTTHHGQTSTLMRHHQLQRHNAPMPAYSGTLREHRSGTMSPSAGSSKYGGTGHRYQYDFQNPEHIYTHGAAMSQQFHQLHGMANRLESGRSNFSSHLILSVFIFGIFQADDHGKMIYYDRKMGNSSKTLKSLGSSSTQQMLASPLKHDYPDWIAAGDPASYQLNKLARHQNDDPMMMVGGSDEMKHGQGPHFSSSYRKKAMYQQQPDNLHSPSHLMANMRGTFGANGEFNGRDMNNRNSWLNNGANNGRHHRQQMNTTDGTMHPNYNSYADEEPVYEEILSRTNENCDGNDLRDYPHTPARDSDLLQNIRVAHTNSTHKMDATNEQQLQQPLHSR